MRFIDAHVHLNDEAFRQDLPEVLARARAAGVERMLVTGYDLAASRRAVELAGEYPEIWAAVGIGPHSAENWNETAKAELAALARAGKVVAIGEIGLDYHYEDLAPRPVQIEVFRDQAGAAVAAGLPIVVHSRESTADTLTVLREFAPRLPGGVLHCFSGSAETAAEAWSLGFRISFGGPLTFANAARLREVAGSVPEAALLTETDAPYLSPHPYRGQRNEPARIELVARELAQARGITLAEVTEVVWQNAERIFGFAGRIGGKR